MKHLVRSFFLLTLFTGIACRAQVVNINRFAGTGAAGFGGDGGPAVSALLNHPADVFKDALGNVYIADKNNNRIRKVNTAGIISTIAGTGVAGYTGDGGPALAATLDHPNRVFVDPAENIYIADESNNVIRKINVAGTITTIVGTGVAGFSGDGGPAILAQLDQPTGVAVDLTGNIFISDYGNNRIRKVNTAGTISTYAGGGGTGFTVDGVLATTISLCGQNYVSVDNSGTIYITNYTCWHFLRVTPADLMYAVAGYFEPGYTGDCRLADSANIQDPFGITPDNLGNIYLCPQGDIRVRRVNSMSYISAVAGSGTAGFSGDGGPALLADVSTSIYGIYADMQGDVYFADQGNNVIRYFTMPFNNDTVCMGGSLTLIDSIGGFGSWSSSNTSVATVGSATGTVTGVSSGTAVITFIGGSCPELFSLYVKPLPALTGGQVCQGASLTLTSSLTGGTWSSANTGVATIGSASGVVFGVAIGTAVISYTMPLGCLSATTVEVVPAAAPIAGNTPVCTGSSITLTNTSSGGVWSSSATGVATIGTGGVVTGVSAGSSTITYQTGPGCYALVTVTVKPLPAAPVITGATTYCQYATYVPPVAAGANILWYTAATGGVGSTIAPVINTSATGTTTIYASQTVAGCEGPRAPFTITVNPVPAAPVIDDVPDLYCYGQAFVPFTVVSGVSILWYTTATGGVGSGVSPTINTAVAGYDTVWASQTVLGCESPRSAVIVTVEANVAAGFMMQDRYGCKADTVLFTNTSTGATAYSWQFGDISAVSVAENPTHVYMAQGTYTVTLYATNSPCIDSNKQVVNLVHPLQAQFLADTNLICQGGTITFTDASVATVPIYFWSFGDGATSNLPNPVHKFPHTGVYTVVENVTDFVPCSDTASMTITVDSTSPMSVTVSDDVICAGTYVTFSGTYSSIGNTGITWNFGNGDSIKNTNPVSYAYPTAGTFTVTASATYRVCDDTSASKVVNIISRPAMDLGPDTTICKGGTPLILTDRINSGNKAASWVWSTGATGPSISVTQPGSYSATVYIGGCSISGTVNITNNCYLNIPNAFSPNNDGVNDYFYPGQSLSAGIISFSMTIYNRWGQEVYSTTATDGRGWDGKFNNIDQPEGVYVYIIDATFKDGQREHHQGNVTLIR